MKKFVAMALAVALAASVCVGCGTKDEEKDFSEANLMVKGFRNFRTDGFWSIVGYGGDLFMEKYPGSVVEFDVGGQGGQGDDLVAAVTAGDPWDVQMVIGTMLPGIFKAGTFEPLDEYVDRKKDTMFTWSLVDQATTYDGHVYAVSNAILGDPFYSTYNEDMFKDFGIKTPIEYYKEGTWNREAVLKVVDDLTKAGYVFAGRFNEPVFDTYTFNRAEDGKMTSAISSKENRDFMEFIKTLLYDKKVADTRGKVEERQAAYYADMPGTLPKQEDYADTIRYIPFPWTQDKGTYIIDYHFSIPRGAKNPDASYELIRCLTQASYDERIKRLKESMIDEDLEIFLKEAVEKAYVVRAPGYGVSAGDTCKDFQAGKSVGQFISENETRAQKAAEDYNAEFFAAK